MSDAIFMSAPFVQTVFLVLERGKAIKHCFGRGDHYDRTVAAQLRHGTRLFQSDNYRSL